MVFLPAAEEFAWIAVQEKFNRVAFPKVTRSFGARVRFVRDTERHDQLIPFAADDGAAAQNAVRAAERNLLSGMPDMVAIEFDRMAEHAAVEVEHHFGCLLFVAGFADGEREGAVFAGFQLNPFRACRRPAFAAEADDRRNRRVAVVVQPDPHGAVVEPYRVADRDRHRHNRLELAQLYGKF